VSWLRINKVKRIFLNLADIDKEDPSHLMMFEFRGQQVV
jgi:hypothetical protein